MKSTLNNACISALLCGVVIIATPALAQLGVEAGATGTTGINGPVNSDVNGTMTTRSTTGATTGATTGTVNTSGALSTHKRPSGASVSTGVSTSGDVNTADASGNAASVNRSTQTTARRLSRSAAETAAEATKSETARQFDQQAMLNARGTASTTVQE